jgi:hypothetical protein
MASFKAAIDQLHLKEIKLNGRRFTWTNEQDNPTLTRIDTLLHSRMGAHLSSLLSTFVAIPHVGPYPVTPTRGATPPS